MGKRTVIFTINGETGELEIEMGEGFTGEACTKMHNQILVGLGTPDETKRTPGFYGGKDPLPNKLNVK